MSSSMPSSVPPSMLSSSISLVVVLAVAFLILASMWKIYSKAGEAGWKSLVPIYGALVYLKITGRPWWWLLLFFIPFVNIIPAIVSCFDLARVFGRGAGFGFGILVLGPIFMVALAFGDARYVGPSRTPVPTMRRAA